MKIKLNIKSVLIIAIIGIISFVSFSPSFAANTAKVTVETANIRKTADANSTILEQISKGDEVEVLEKTDNWCKIKFNGITGYVRIDLLDVEQESKKAEVNETKQTETQENKNEAKEQVNVTSSESNAKTTTTSEEKKEEAKKETVSTEKLTSNTGMYTCKEEAKLRIMPLLIGNEIKTINKDENVSVLEINNKWALVESGTNRGWVLLSQIEEVATEETKTEETSAEVVEESEEKDENSTQANEQKEEEKIEEQSQESVEEKSEEQATETTESTETSENKAEETPVQEKTMYVNSEVINLRQEATTSSESIAKLAKGTKVTVTSENDGWSKASVNGKEGYIASSLLSETKPEIPTSRKAEEPRQDIETKSNNNENTEKTKKETESSKKTSTSSSSSKGQEVCNYAKQFLGCKYVYGGTSPSGFDCSGFTQYVYKHFGVTINRTAEAQASNGTAVSKSNLKPGDILIFTGHAGIYIGDGKFIHAANSRKGVIITSLSDSYYVRNYKTARRIFY